jgi:hypothetical protein
MNKLAMITILVIAAFLFGCAANEIGTNDDEPTTKTTSTKFTATKTTATTAKTATTTKTTSTNSYADPAHATEETGRVTVPESDTGGSVTFKKLGTGERTKTTTEKCNLDSPLECSKYFANDGIVYIMVKNQGYTSKLNDFVLKLNGEECDPVNTYIETGQLKEFQCFVTETDVVSGSLEAKYYSPIEQSDFLKKGTIVVLME